MDTKFQFAILFTNEDLAIEFNRFLFQKYEKKALKFYLKNKSVIFRTFFNSREKAIEIKDKNVFLLKEFIKEQKLKLHLGIKEEIKEERLKEQCPNCNFIIYGWSEREIKENKKLHFTLKHHRRNRSRYQRDSI